MRLYACVMCAFSVLVNVLTVWESLILPWAACLKNKIENSKRKWWNNVLNRSPYLVAQDCSICVLLAFRRSRLKTLYNILKESSTSAHLELIFMSCLFFSFFFLFISDDVLPFACCLESGSRAGLRIAGGQNQATTTWRRDANPSGWTHSTDPCPGARDFAQTKGIGRQSPSSRRSREIQVNTKSLLFQLKLQG